MGGEHRLAPGLPLSLFLRHLYVLDVDALAAEFAVETQPWAREIQFTDSDCNRWRVGERILS